ncbi:radical SAM protein [Actinoplanes sp. RD1]|uniref:radical SAM protein n=1 Tax=Actinoplanes sp. RD1 TaxID=3064538 RepID=UPI00274103DD|nr:radical SAM protein [Actinoplanes sp. RD1]
MPFEPIAARAPRRSHVLVQDGVRLREETFGSLVYSPEVDRFAALDPDHTALIRAAIARRDDVDDDLWPLAEGKRTGVLRKALISADPLVVNVFATALCPLRCRYCHADDLMAPFRAGESDADLDGVIATATAVPAMTAVVTGGDPILNPDRTERLIKALSPAKAIVVDSSGAGDVTPLLRVLKEVRGHLRVSLDSAAAPLHDRLRPINPGLLPRGSSSHALAWATIAHALAADVPTTVQTVVSSLTEDAKGLLTLAERLAAAGVRNWVLHVAVPAGKAALPRNQHLLPSNGVREMLGHVLERLAAGEQFRRLRVRITTTHLNPNAVLLVGSRGDLYVETGSGGKKRITGPTDDAVAVARLFRRHVDRRAHADRYLGGISPAAG